VSEPTVSICIRGWRRDTLPRAIESVLAQGRDDVEVIVGDDGGDVGDVVARFGDPRVHYRRSPAPMTMSAHVRALLSESRGRYVGLLDDDDRLLPGYLDATIGRLDADPSVGIAFTNYFYDVGGRLHERKWPLADGRHERFLAAILRGCPIAASAALIRRAAWEDGERRHPLRDDTFADATMWMRAAEAGWAFHFVDDRLAVYAVHPGQTTHGQQQHIRDRSVRLWQSFRFDDAESERLRRRRLAEALLIRANLHLRRRRIGSAARDVRAARAAAPGRFGEREVVALLGARQFAARLLARHPVLVGPALSAWRFLQRLDRIV
jgi:glycosyltransferase involved in cell wall biosynthesis